MSRYATPLGFKEALEARLRAASKVSGQEQNRLRMRLVIDRFAARVSAEFGDDVVLKGGVVLELRLAEARATKDLDLRLVGDPELTLARLQRAGRIALDDHLASPTTILTPPWPCLGGVFRFWQERDLRGYRARDVAARAALHAEILARPSVTVGTCLRGDYDVDRPRCDAGRRHRVRGRRGP